MKAVEQLAGMADHRGDGSLAHHLHIRAERQFFDGRAGCLGKGAFPSRLRVGVVIAVDLAENDLEILKVA